MCMYPFFFSSQGQFTFEGVHSYLRVTSTSLKKNLNVTTCYIFLFSLYIRVVSPTIITCSKG